MAPLAFPPLLNASGSGSPAVQLKPLGVASAFAYQSALFHHHCTIHASAPCVVTPSPDVLPTPIAAWSASASCDSEAETRSSREMFGPIVPCLGQYASPVGSTAELGVATACRPLPFAICPPKSPGPVSCLT